MCPQPASACASVGAHERQPGRARAGDDPKGEPRHNTCMVIATTPGDHNEGEMVVIDMIVYQEADLRQKAVLCIQYIQEALQNRDYETMAIEISELQYLVRQLQELEQKEARRQQLLAIIQDMHRRGIQIDFVRLGEERDV
ncbi:hypothetical protein MAH48_14245 [Anoxybacillus flavithermus]|nr:hypothetical protein [Anoxybacillus flavithermus]